MISPFSLSEKSESAENQSKERSNVAIEDAAADAYKVPSAYIDFCRSLGAVAGKGYRWNAAILDFFGEYPESAKELRRTAKDLENLWGLFDTRNSDH